MPVECRNKGGEKGEEIKEGFRKSSDEYSV